MLSRIKQMMKEQSNNEVMYVWILNLIEDDSTVVYSNDYYAVKVDSKNIVRLEDKKDGVVIMPVTSLGEILLIKSKRPIIGNESWEFPRGFKESKEISRDAAMRELKDGFTLGATLLSESALYEETNIEVGSLIS